MYGKHYMVMVAAAAAMALASTRTAQAQYRTGNDGHVLDNSNQVGSGGYNTPHDVNPTATGANLNYTYGNTAGLSAFQGGAIPDPTQFQGNIPRGELAMDNFNRVAAGSTVGPAPGAGPELYYGATRFVPPPAGFTQFGASGGYIPATPAYTTDNDTRLGYVTYGSDVETINVGGYSGSPETNFVDTNPNTQQFYTASPLYGNQQWSTNDFGNLATTGLAPNGARVDETTVLRLRSQMNGDQNYAPTLNGLPVNGALPNGATVPQAAGAASETNQAGTNGPSNRSLSSSAPRTAGPGGGLISASPLAGATPTTGRPGYLSGQPLNSSMATPAVPSWRVTGAMPLAPIDASGASTDQSLRQQFLVSPAQQSTQYAELQRRLDAYNAQQPENDQQAHEQFLAQQRAMNAAKTGAAGVNGPGATALPGADARPGAIPEPSAAAPVPAAGEPMQVNSFSEGVGAAGLHDILSNAEQLMKQGRYNAAVDEYNTAAAVAPNNPLIVLGRANAELGSASYARCEIDLRSAYTTDQALMMAQYNITSLIGKDRVDQLISELKQNAVASPNDETPVFLLAYIAYNTHDVGKAAGYLQLAQQREGGQDALLASLRQHWNLPTTQPTDLNK